MSEAEQIDYYKNRFQALLLENNELQKQIDLYKMISSMKEDLINEQNKLIDAMNRRLKIYDGRNATREN